MDLETFKKNREARLLEAPQYRNLCMQCRQPQFSCYCVHIQKFDPGLKFVILIHPIEVRRRIATGRMSHLCLENSELIAGQDYSENARVNEILENPEIQPLILYPGRTSVNLTPLSSDERKSYFCADKTPVIFVIDGTWATARKTMHLSQNLKRVPRVCFTPPHRSQFRVRKQPGVDCFSTIEAIHHVLELFGVGSGQQDRLLHVFQKMVERQLEFVKDALENPRSTTYRRPWRGPCESPEG